MKKVSVEMTLSEAVAYQCLMALRSGKNPLATDQRDDVIEGALALSETGSRKTALQYLSCLGGAKGAGRTGEMFRNFRCNWNGKPSKRALAQFLRERQITA